MQPVVSLRGDLPQDITHATQSLAQQLINGPLMYSESVRKIYMCYPHAINIPVADAGHMQALRLSTWSLCFSLLTCIHADAVIGLLRC